MGGRKIVTILLYNRVSRKVHDKNSAIEQKPMGVRGGSYRVIEEGR